MSCATCGLANPERSAQCIRCGESLSLDYFQVLDVSRDATAEQIRKARREKLRSCHPDLVNTLAPEFRRLAAAKAAQINGIADTLGDPAKRRAYLASRQTAPPGPAANGSAAKPPRPAETPRPPGGQKAPGGPGSPGGERGKAAPGAQRPGGQPHMPKSAEEILEILTSPHRLVDSQAGAQRGAPEGGARQAPPPAPSDRQEPAASSVRRWTVRWVRAYVARRPGRAVLAIETVLLAGAALGDWMNWQLLQDGLFLAALAIAMGWSTWRFSVNAAKRRPMEGSMAPARSPVRRALRILGRIALVWIALGPLAGIGRLLSEGQPVAAGVLAIACALSLWWQVRARRAAAEGEGLTAQTSNTRTHGGDASIVGAR